MPDIWLLILLMAVVTYIPRALPAILMQKLEIRGRAKRFLDLIPYTAMSVLVFPGVITADASRPEIGIAGGLIAILLAWHKCPLVICVLAAILSNWMIYTFF